MEEPNLSQELVNLLIKLKERASSADKLGLKENIDLIKQTTIPFKPYSFIQICYYLMLLTSHYPNLMNEFNKKNFEEFQIKIGLVDDSHQINQTSKK
jgi:hypothetical protein